MLGLAIAIIIGGPVAFLAVGFYGVSKKHAEESREHLRPQPPEPPISKPVQDTASKTIRPGSYPTTGETYSASNSTT